MSIFHDNPASDSCYSIFDKEQVLTRLRAIDDLARDKGLSALDPRADRLIPIGMELESRGRVRKNGYGVFNTINNENLRKAIVTCPECGCTFHRTGHCQVFDEDRIRSLFSDKGFKLVKIRKLNLGYISMFKFFASVFYFLHLDRMFKVELLTRDMFFVVRKEKDIE